MEKGQLRASALPSVRLSFRHSSPSVPPSTTISMNSPSGISTSSSNDSDSLPLLSLLLVLVPPLQEELEQVPQELKGDVLESERGSVEEFEDVLLFRDLVERSGLRVSEGGVGSVDEGLEVGGGDLRGRDEEREDVVRQIGERKPSPGSLPVGGEGRESFRDVESSVGSESSENSLEKERVRKDRRKEGRKVSLLVLFNSSLSMYSCSPARK